MITVADTDHKRTCRYGCSIARGLERRVTMAALTVIDPDEDFAAYYRDDWDPDSGCERLYVWHRALWSRSVAGVTPFELDVVYDRGYEMQLRAADGSQFRLASDGIIATWSTPGWAHRFEPEVFAEITKDTDDFFRVGSTIGGYILFPRNRTGQTGHTINQARAWALGDRFDLTLECIRRHYTDPLAENPLGDRLAYYADFFALFGDFSSYVRFFLLEDLVTPDCGAVHSLMTGDPLNGFDAPALAASAAQYAEFRRRSIAFVTGRNNRIRQLRM